MRFGRRGPMQSGAMDIELLFAALLAILPRVPEPMRGCIEQRRHDIVQQIHFAALAQGVPPAVLLVVGMLESHYGCAARSGGCWGAPIDPTHRLTAGTPHHAAVALSTSFRVCRTWQGAISRFRCGLCACRPHPERGYTAEYAARLVERVHQRAGWPLAPGAMRRRRDPHDRSASLR